LQINGGIKLKKKIMVLLIASALSTMSFSSERDDMKYINRLFKAKEYSLAAKELEYFISRYPRSSSIKSSLERVAKTYFFEKDYRKSKHYFTEYLRLANPKGKKRDDTLYYISRNELYLKNPNGAIRRINSITRTSPRKEDGVYHLARYHYNNKNYTKALKYLNILKTKERYRTDVLIYLAMITKDRKDYAKANIYLDEFLAEAGATNSKLDLAYNTKVSINSTLKRESEVSRYLNKLETSYPNSPYLNNARYLALKMYLSKGKISKVNQLLGKLKWSKYEVVANGVVGQSFLNKKQYSKALPYYEETKDRTKDQAIIYGLGYSLYKTGNYDDALLEFEKVIKGRYSKEVIYYSAKIYYENKDYRNVIKLASKFKVASVGRKYRNNFELMLGKSYYETKNYTKAIRSYEKVYARTKKKSDLYNIILASSKLNDTAYLEKKFKEYVKRFPNDKKYLKNVYMLMGNRYYKLKKYAKAKEVYSGYKGNSKEISENLVTLLVKEGDYKALIKTLKAKNKTPENIYLLGTAYLGLSQYTNAEKEFVKIINNKNLKAELKEKAHSYLVRTYFGKRDYNKAISSGRQYLSKVYNGKSEIKDFIALSNFRLEKYDAARQWFKNLGKDSKYRDYSDFQIAETYYNEGKYSQALSKYLDVSKRKSKYATKALYWATNVSYIEKDYEKVIQKGEEFLVKYPTSDYSADVRSLIGQSYVNSNNSEKAISSYKKLYSSAKTKEAKEDAKEKLMSIYFESGEYSKSYVWNRRLANSPKKTYWAGRIFEKTKEYKNFEREYKKLVKDPDYGDRANYALANYYQKKKQFTKAKPHYEKILELENSNFKDRALYQLGNIELSGKNYDEAIRRFTRVELLYSKSNYAEPSLLKIAEISEKRKDNKKAIKTYKKFLDKYKDSKFKTLAYEKLIVLNLRGAKDGNNRAKAEAKKYYETLKKIDSGLANPYTKYFKDELVVRS